MPTDRAIKQHLQAISSQAREPQPALAKRILDFQGAVEDLTILHVL